MSDTPKKPFISGKYRSSGNNSDNKRSERGGNDRRSSSDSRSERSERGDRNDRSERGGRSERSHSGRGSSDRGRFERDRSERGVRSERRHDRNDSDRPRSNRSSERSYGERSERPDYNRPRSEKPRYEREGSREDRPYSDRPRRDDDKKWGKKPHDKKHGSKGGKKQYGDKKWDKPRSYEGKKETYTPPLDYHNAYLIYGRYPSVLALKNENRVIKKIICSQNGLNFLKDKVEEKYLNLPTDIIDTHKLDTMLPPDSNHQGVILEAEPIVQPELESVLNGEHKLVVLLDQLTDPHNIGAIIRSSAAFGAGAVITTERASPPENAIIIKTSAGTFETVPYIRGGNLNDAILKLKTAGFYVIGLDGEGETDISKITGRAGRYAVIIGAEGKGLRHLVKQNCDVVAKIGIAEGVESLNASVAAAVALFAISSITKN